MKKVRTIVAIFFLSMILSGVTSCEVSRHSDEGRHRGWFHRHDEDRRDNRGPVIIIHKDQDDHDR